LIHARGDMRIPVTVSHVAILTCLALSWAACKSEKGQTQWIEASKLKPGPVRHEVLTDGQMDRVKALQTTFAEVDPTPLESWVNDFKRDIDPERELRTYEGMAKAYRAYCQGRSLSAGAKMDVYRVVLLRSGAPDEDVLPRLKLKELSAADAKDILRLYTEPPQPLTVTSSPGQP
jgi:hypothetical protein